jgi:hypothetical protein
VNSILKVHGWSGPLALLPVATQINDEVMEFACTESIQGTTDPFGEDVAALGPLPNGVILNSELDDKGSDTATQIAMAVVLFVGSAGGEWLVDGFLDRFWAMCKNKLVRLRDATNSKGLSGDSSSPSVAIQICHVGNGSLLEVRVSLSDRADAELILSKVENIIRSGAETISRDRDVTVRDGM